MSALPEYRNCKKKSIALMIQGSFFPDVELNKRYFHSFVNHEECSAAIKVCSQICGIRMVYRETFLLVYVRVLRHLMQECSILGTLM